MEEYKENIIEMIAEIEIYVNFLKEVFEKMVCAIANLKELID